MRTASHRDTLNGAVEFDTVRSVPQRDIETQIDGFYAPEVSWADDTHHVESGEWIPVDGYSHQYRYSGPVMHASEYLGGAMADAVLEAGGIYVLVVVEVIDDPNHDYSRENPEPAGWILLQHLGNEERI